MLSVSNLSFSYRGGEVFEGASASFPAVGVVAVIGDNGSGKSTLLKLLAGELKPDDGVVRADGVVEYLSQDLTESVVGDAVGVLVSGGLPAKYGEMSGGERTRRALEKILARDYDILLLDEPTNNLDAEGRAWLMGEVLGFRGLVVVVSHDREFIDQVADYVAEVKDGKIKMFVGNYRDFAARREQERTEQAREYAKAEHQRRVLMEQVERAKARSGRRGFDKTRDENKWGFNFRENRAQVNAGRAAKTAMTKLARLEAVEKPRERKVYAAKIEADFCRRRRLLSVKEVGCVVAGGEVFRGVSFEIFTGERCRITGRNGAGKSTLMKMIMEANGAEVSGGEGLAGEVGGTRAEGVSGSGTDGAWLGSGEIRLAPGLKLGYIAQDVQGLDLRRSFLEQVEANGTEVFQAAATMDFRPEDLRRLCGELSRGQRVKLAFLKAVLWPVDLLILDEPTNHLDIRARENIENALAEYAGAILFATHDEVLVGRLGAEKVVRLGS